ncbi:GntR family transcriptional regulator [bacterium]|nr:GntR family transcriptional regulator [bacterium]
MQKKDLRQIVIDEISFKLPDLKNSTEQKSVAISKWIMEWIDEDIKSNKIHYQDLLPSKADFAFLLGVSIGTIQNALRFVEDAGYVESKQCIGTLIKDKNNQSSIRKLTSKREMATENLKKYIKNNNLQIGAILLSSRTLAKEINSSPNTTRLALKALHNEGIIEPKSTGSNDFEWAIKSTNFEINKTSVMQETLVTKVEQDLKDYITENLSIGEKLPPHETLAQNLKVSIKTIHDALKTLIDDGILLPRRGRYGTSVIKMPNDKTIDIGKETSIFASAQETAFYYYERTQNQIKKIISENYSIGDKLPSILELSKSMDLSPNTIRKAFHNLAKEGYLTFSRGRYGGTFVVDIPETETQTFKWLAVNPKYAETYN